MLQCIWHPHEFFITPQLLFTNRSTTFSPSQEISIKYIPGFNRETGKFWCWPENDFCITRTPSTSKTDRLQTFAMPAGCSILNTDFTGFGKSFIPSEKGNSSAEVMISDFHVSFSR